MKFKVSEVIDLNHAKFKSEFGVFNAEWNGTPLTQNQEIEGEIELNESFTLGENLFISEENVHSIREEGVVTLLNLQIAQIFEDNIIGVRFNDCGVFLIEVGSVQGLKPHQMIQIIANNVALWEN